MLKKRLDEAILSNNTLKKENSDLKQKVSIHLLLIFEQKFPAVFKLICNFFILK